MEKIRIGMIGFGGRGYGLLTHILLPRENVEVTAVCDLYPDRMEKAAAAVEEKKGNRPFATANYKEVTCRNDVDAVVICGSGRRLFAQRLLPSGGGIRAHRYALYDAGELLLRPPGTDDHPHGA